MKVVHILPNLRKGLSRNISSDIKDAEGLRAGFNVNVQMDGHKADSDCTEQKSLLHQFLLAGPVDVKGINAKAISQVVPADKSIGFSNGYMPYVEFLDEDLPWRYTPLPSSDKLVPWLLLIACKDGEFKVNQKHEGMKSVTISLAGTDGDDLSTFYPDPAQFHKLAHVQINAPEGIDPLIHIKDNPDDGVSRLFCSRKLLPKTKYTMFLVPAFELGRLAGLKEILSDSVGVEKLSWENGSTSNEFPIYYQWSFTSGAETFLKLARLQNFLSDEEVEGLSSGLKADISDTGLKKYRTGDQPVDDSEPIDIPVALLKKGFSEAQLIEEDPQMRKELKEDLLLKSPVFSQNTSAGEVYEDPWVVPPVYGARHILANTEKLDDDSSFLKDLNLKFRNRVAAGMGANVVKRNQEMFVNRAWGVIEDINALNQRIREFYQVLKTNDASEEKITSLRYYKFRPHAWGLQADAAIRVANAQSSAKLNAVDLALDATDDSGKALNVMTTSLGPFTRNGGISVQELRDLTDPALWSTNASGIIPREEPYRYVSGQDDYFNRNSNYYFLRDFFSIGHPNLSYSVQDGAPKLSLTPGVHGTLFSFERTNVVNPGIFPELMKSSSLICDSDYVFRWLEDSALFSFENNIPVKTLKDLNQMMEDSQKEFDKVWNGTALPNYDKIIPFFSSFISWSPFMSMVASGMCLPVLFQCDGAYNFEVKLIDGSSISVPNTDYGVFMHRSYYDKVFGQFDPDGVAVRYFVNNKAYYQYFIPSDKIYDLVSTGNFKLVYGYIAKNRDEYVVELKYKNNSRDLFEPIDDKQFKTPIWFGGICLNYSDKTLLPRNRYDCIPAHSNSSQSNNRLLYFRNTLLSSTVNLWPEGLKGKRKMYAEYQTRNVDPKIQYDTGRKACDVFKDNSKKIYLSYDNGKLFLVQRTVVTDRIDTGICLSDGDGLFQKNGEDVTVDLDAVFNLLSTAKDNINWFSNHIWRPNAVQCSTQYYKSIKVLSADDIAGASIDSLTKELLSTYDKAMTQVTELHNIAMTDPELKKALEGRIDNAVSNIDPQAEAPVVDADEINRKRLVDLADEFAEKGMTLDLKESNFDGKYPIMAAPIFPDPTSFYLRELSERFILPSVEELKNNSISCFESNLAFEEAFLAGMNTEMGRELLWREYPTDERGSYFRKFWDQVEIPDDFGNKYFDVKYMHNWNNRLGGNHDPGKGKMLVFVVKSELMKSYPQTSICLSQVKNNQGNNELSCILSPAMTGWLSNDTFMAGFYTNELKSYQGVYLTFVETDKSQRFNREYSQGGPDSLSSQFATNRADFGSVWGVEVEPSLLKL